MHAYQYSLKEIGRQKCVERSLKGKLNGSAIQI